jgi:hypothetical protein
MGTCEVPNSSFFMALSSSISACWVEMMFRERSFNSLCSASSRAIYGALVVGDHRVDKALVGVLAVLHDHLAGHALGTHAHGAVAHLVVATAARLVALLTTSHATARSRDEGYRQEQREEPRFAQ